MSLTNDISCRVEDFVVYIQDYLNKIQAIKNFKEKYTVEFYVDDVVCCDINIEKEEDVIFQCLSFYKRLLNEILCKNNKKININDLKENFKIRVFDNPSGILHINSIINLGINNSCVDVYIYEKEKNKNELLEYIKKNNLNDIQKEYMINSFEQNDVYNKNLSSILDDIKKEVLDAIDKPSLQNLINDMNYTIFDLINEDISEVIIGLIDKSNETYSIYKNLISVVKVEQGYLIMFCKDIIYEIKYNLGLCIVEV